MSTSVGHVGGVDVGFSQKRASSAVCKLEWDHRNIYWNVRRYRISEREQALKCMLGSRQLLAVAFDGPLRGDLDEIGEYRTAERNLTRQLGRKIGKPGQSSSPTGRRLNQEANCCARAVLYQSDVAQALHEHNIADKAIVEAFPTSFLGAMLSESEIPLTSRAKRSDAFYTALTKNGSLKALLAHLLPGRDIACEFASVTDHDERAALICAISALCVVKGNYSIVGDKRNGWIVLPPCRFVQGWAQVMLAENGVQDASYACSCGPTPPSPPARS